ncbi:MAG: acyltransferase family protein [Methyloligellaceae bacterium]
MSEVIPTQRLHYMDSLRALAMILGVFFHAAICYAITFQDAWIVKDKSSELITVFVILSGSFRMPLFFVVAGFFANMLLQKRGTQAFIKNRLIRLTLPLIIFLPVLLGALALLVIFGEYYSGKLNEAANLNQDIKTHHLWFIYYLSIFIALALTVHRVESDILENIREFILSRAYFLLLIPLFVAPAIYLNGGEVEAAVALIPELWMFGYFGLFFFLGWHIFAYQNFFSLVERHLLKLFVASGILFIVLLYMLQTNTTDAKIPPVTFAVTGAYTTFYLILTAIGLGRRYLNREKRWMRYMSDASYWIYLTHVPLVMLFHILLKPVDINLWIKYWITVAATMLIATISYHYLVRYTVIGAMLNGKRERSHMETSKVSV